MLLHGGERVGDLFHVVVIQTRHADTTAGNQVDTELFTQAINLRDAETGVTEHPTLLQQVVKITARQRHFQAVDQRLAHSRIRMRMLSTSSSHWAFSCASPSTFATTCAPKFGGLE